MTNAYAIAVLVYRALRWLNPMRLVRFIRDTWRDGRRGDWVRTGLQDEVGRDTWIWDSRAIRKKGWFQNNLEALSQLGNAFFLNGHANLTTSAQSGSWQRVNVPIRGTLLPRLINHFMWVVSLRWLRGKPVDKLHCLNAWREKV